MDEGTHTLRASPRRGNRQESRLSKLLFRKRHLRDRDADTHNNRRNEGTNSSARTSAFPRRQAERSYPDIFDKSVEAAGEAQLAQFPKVPPESVPPIISSTLGDYNRNHASMEFGFVQYDFNKGVRKGETASGYGDGFCQVHGITRVWVVDRVNHLIAMCTPHRYMAFMANKMYLRPEARFKGNIFEFGGPVVATPRWAMRAAAWQILLGQGGCVTKEGDTISISGACMKNGIATPPEPLFKAPIPFSGVSWIVMDTWLADARSHKVSIIAADTGLTRLRGKYDPGSTLPMVIREDEADMLMGDPVFGLAVEDDRFEPLRKTGEITQDTKALQFRAGWYAPYKPDGVTRIMRLLKLDEKDGRFIAADGTGPWRKPEKAYSNRFVRPPTRELWAIGGVDNVHEKALAKNLGTHEEMDIHLGDGKGLS